MQTKPLANPLISPINLSGAVGIYGGTFDPIHFGHLNLALELLETHHLSEVWFCPAMQNPHKEKILPTSIHHRMEMIKLAIAAIPQFQLLDIEARRQPPSYTIDTLRLLINEEEKKTIKRQFCLIIGDDSIERFSDWKEANELIQLMPILIGRCGKAVEIPNPPIHNTILMTLMQQITPTRVLNIHSTEIRQRINKRLYCGNLLPIKVIDYISRHHLYLS